MSRGTHLSVVGYDVYFFESFLAVLEDDVEMSLLLMYNKFKERMEFLLVSNFPQLVFAVFNQKLNGSQCNYKDLIKVQRSLFLILGKSFYEQCDQILKKEKINSTFV